MKKLMLGLLLLVGFNGWGQEDVLETRKEFFNSRQDLNKYIFQNSELDKITKGFFLDYIPEFEPEAKKLFLYLMPQWFVKMIIPLLGLIFRFGFFQKTTLNLKLKSCFLKESKTKN